MIKINITDKAKKYLLKLSKQPVNQGKELYLRVADANTAKAEAVLAFVHIAPYHADDFTITMGDKQLFVDRQSASFLDQAAIDIKKTDLQSELVIDVPNLSTTPPYDENAPLVKRIAWVLTMEINPSLAEHGGRVRLIEVTDDGIVKLEFGGGCQGCGMVDTTLHQGIAATLMERFPEVTDIEDVTDHGLAEDPFF